LIPLFGTGAIWVDDNNVDEVNRQQFATLSQVIAQASDQGAQELLARIREVEARGYVIRGAVIEASRRHTQ
jgi:BMFP domain-containing protein YqiC